MPVKRKTIALIFAGGTTLVTDQGVRDIRTEQDIQPWLKMIPELALIATIKPVFVPPSSADDNSPNAWVHLAHLLRKYEKNVDGFVLTQPFEHIPYTAAALTLFLKTLGKPVVITGSPDTARTLFKKTPQLLEERGIRSHLVNAVHAATLDIAEVAVLFGNHILRGGSVVYQSHLHTAVLHSPQPHIGRLDFGLKLDPARTHRSKSRIRFRGGFSAHVLSLTPLPGQQLQAPDLKNIDGILVFGQTGASYATLQSVATTAHRAGVPVAVYTHAPSPDWRDVITLQHVTPAMAYVKFLWALAQTSSTVALRRLLHKDTAGEMLSTPLSRP